MSDTPPEIVTPEAQEVDVADAPEATNAEGYRALREEAKVEEGEEEPSIPVRDKKFRVAENIPGIVLLDLGLASDPAATQGEQLRAMRQFLHAAIHEDDVAAFEHYLRTARPVIDIEELGKLVEALTAQVAGTDPK